MVAVMFAPAVDTMMGSQAETVTVTPSLTDSRAALARAARPTRMAGRARRMASDVSANRSQKEQMAGGSG